MSSAVDPPATSPTASSSHVYHTYQESTDLESQINFRKGVISRVAVGILCMIAYDVVLYASMLIPIPSPLLLATVRVAAGAVFVLSGFCFVFWKNLPPWTSSSPNPHNHLNTLSSILARVIVAATSVLSFWIAGLAYAGTWTFSASWVVPTIIATGIVTGCVALFCAVFWNKIPSWLFHSKPSSENGNSSNVQQEIESYTAAVEVSSQSVTRTSEEAPQVTLDQSNSSTESTSSVFSETHATSLPSSGNNGTTGTQATSLPSRPPISSGSDNRSSSSNSQASTAPSPMISVPRAENSTHETTTAAHLPPTPIMINSAWPYYYRHSDDVFGLTSIEYPRSYPDGREGPLNIVEFYQHGVIPIAQDPNAPNFGGFHGITLNTFLLAEEWASIGGRCRFAPRLVREATMLTAGKIFFYNPVLFPLDRVTDDLQYRVVPVLDQRTRDTFRNSPHLKNQVIRVLKTYFTIYNFEIQGTNPPIITETSRFKGLKIPAKAGEIPAKAGVCRIHHSLYLLGLPEYSHAFFAALQNIYNRERQSPDFQESEALIQNETYQLLLTQETSHEHPS